MLEWLMRDCFNIADVLFIGGTCIFIGAFLSNSLHGDYRDEDEDKD